MILYENTPYLREVVNQTGHKDLRSLLFLHYIVENVRPEYIVELGTGFGCSTIFMALATHGKIISIDDYRGDMAEDTLVVEKNLINCGVSDKVELIKGDSRNIEINCNPEVAFMDASHNNDDLWKEFEGLQKYLTSDHVLIVDDIYTPAIEHFISGLYSKYEACFILKVHNGMAVFITDVDKYLNNITDAITKAFQHV